MIEQFRKLTREEAELLLKAPVLVSVLAVSGDKEISKGEKADAIKLAHLKTFTADSLLQPYYKEAEKNFKSDFEAIVKKYTPFDDSKRELLKGEINILNKVIAKLNGEFAKKLHRSLTSYAEHVKRSDRVFFENFVFPIPIHGLSD